VRRISIVLLALAAACAESGGGEIEREDSAACRVMVRDLTLPEDIREASGVAFSRTLKGVLWTHNDSGNDPALFAIDGRAAAVATLPVPAEIRDWEDMALGPCPQGSCVYMADTGDSGRGSDPVALLVAPEPRSADAPVGPIRRYTAQYPDRAARDAEAMFVLPSGDVYLITKGSRHPIEIFRWPTPLREGAPVILVPVRGLGERPDQPGDRVTGAGASPDGRFVAVRTYSLLNVYRTADLLGGGAPTPVRRTDLVPLGEAQGEGVALADDGTVALVSEGHGKHVPGTLSLLHCPLQ
jgi:hypothetical protein